MTNTVNSPDAHVRVIKNGIANLLLLAGSGNGELEKALNFAATAMFEEVKLLEASLAG